MNSKIGERIKERRKELCLSGSVIHEKTGISTGNLSMIEKGKSLPSSTALIGLSKVLDCSIDWILTGQDFSSSLQQLDNYVNLTPDENKLLSLFGQMSDSDQKELLLFAEFRIQVSNQLPITL